MTKMIILLFIVLLFCVTSPRVSVAFTSHHDVGVCRPFPRNSLQASTIDNVIGSEGPVMDTPWKHEGGLVGLLQAAEKASIPCGADTSEGAHDAFRYEWGRWIDDESMQDLMDRINEVQLSNGVIDTLIPKDSKKGELSAQRFRLGGGENWDCLLHVLPQGAEWRQRWPTGAWAVVRALTGVAEIAMLRGPNRDGIYTKATKKALRGGGDGTLAGGTAGGGEDCVKYVGGAFRSYSGKSGRTTLIEVAVRPPVGKEQLDGDGRCSSDIPQLDNPEKYLEFVVPNNEETTLDESENDSQEHHAVSEVQPTHLGAKMGMSFEKVGGLDEQLNAIVRRVLASRYVFWYTHLP